MKEVYIDIVVKPMTVCLGDCYRDEDCTDLIVENVPCFACLAIDGVPNSGIPNGVRWKPTTRCPDRDLHCPDCCLDMCPTCCDGKDDDGDYKIDCPDDPGCACCCDESETDDSSVPCVPELATFTMFGVGLLLIVGIGMRRRE